MVSLPGWGGPWERRERLGSDGSDIAKKRYKLGHPGVHQTKDWAVDGYIDTFKSIIPAKMFITLRYEPDVYAVNGTACGEAGCVSNSNGKYYGSPAEYRAWWSRVWNQFKDANVTNAVWAVDYSTHSSTEPEYHPLLAALWPEEGQVDWLLFNMFCTSAKQQGYSFDGLLNATYAQFEAALYAVGRRVPRRQLQGHPRVGPRRVGPQLGQGLAAALGEGARRLHRLRL